MSKRNRRIEKTVGSFVESPDGSYYELDYGANCYGDVDMFYRDTEEDHPGGGICYIRSLDEGNIIYADDPELESYGYTYDEVVEICNGHSNYAEIALEMAGGYSIETMWERIEMDIEEESC